MQTILIIDDAQELLFLTSMRLSAFGFKTMTAPGGAEGFELAINEIPDCIILDIEMPGMDGYETLRQLMNHEKTQHIAVIMYTGLDESRDGGKAVRLGARRYVQKDHGPEQLLNAIREQFPLS